MSKPIFKEVTLERLNGPSLREERRAHLRAEGVALLADERRAKREHRKAVRAVRKQDRANSFGWSAFADPQSGDHEYAECAQGRTRIRIAEDENGDLLFPRDFTSQWYERLRWWKPLHLLAWLRTRQTGQLVWVESE